MTEEELRFEFDPSLDEGFPAARAHFGAWLDGLGIDGDDGEELHVVLSELMANAVEATHGDDPISVWAQRQGAKVWLSLIHI